MNPPRIDDVQEIEIRGPWNTKSDAELSVLFQIPFSELERFFNYDANIDPDIRGLRSYTVQGVQKGSKGGMEFHKVRSEYIFALRGKFDVFIGDVYGAEKTVQIGRKKGILVPPNVMHTYTCVEPGDLVIIANTTFDPDDSKTHDTYRQDEFEQLREKYA